jgi:hypothetical protein
MWSLTTALSPPLLPLVAMSPPASSIEAHGAPPNLMSVLQDLIYLIAYAYYSTQRNDIQF